jgi:hypothetical protein
VRCDGVRILVYDPDHVYKIRHFLDFFSRFVIRAARVACSNTSRTPSFVFAEHSRYFWAPIFLRTSSAWLVLRVQLRGDGGGTYLLRSYGLLGSLV